MIYENMKNYSRIPWHYQKSLPTSQVISSIPRSLSESYIAKFLGSSYLETLVSTLYITLPTSLSRRRRSETSSFMKTCVYIDLLLMTIRKLHGFSKKSLFTQVFVKAI